MTEYKIKILDVITQNTHGFVVGDVLKFASNVYAKAQANTEANAEVIGIVSKVANVNNFVLCTNGYVEGLSGLVANTLYYLSDSVAGALTSTAPTTEGYVNKPIFYSISTTAGYFLNYRGTVIEANTGSNYVKTFDNTDLAAGILTVTHNFNNKYCTVQVFDNNDIMILPDSITLTDVNNVSVDLSSYGVISGTWHAVVLLTGSEAVSDSFLVMQVFS